jgi:predicted KAP-like P-loop ATPase
MMNNDETQRRIEFIIEQQAQFSADIQQLKETQIRAQEQIDTLREAQVQAEARASRVEEAIIRLVNVVERLADAQTQTDERLNVFINVVERYMSEGRNGKE